MYLQKLSPLILAPVLVLLSPLKIKLAALSI